MKLLPLDTPEIIDLVASWLTRRENYQWLGFENEGQLVTPALLKIGGHAKRPTAVNRHHVAAHVIA